MSFPARFAGVCVFCLLLAVTDELILAQSPPARPAAAQEKIPTEGAIEVKWGGQWRKASIIGHEGTELFLVQYAGQAASQAEWVTMDRMRANGSTRDVPYATPNAPGVKPVVAAKPAASAPGAGAAAATPGAGVAPAARDDTPHEGKVDVKWGLQWFKATIIKHDGPDLFLVQYDGEGAGQAEWVTADRMRPIGSTRDNGVYAKPNPPGVKPAVPPKPAVAGTPVAPATGAPAAPGAVTPVAQEKIPHDGNVEVKWGGLWFKATIIKHDGPELFLVQYERRPVSQAEWVTEDRMRAIGSTRDIPYASPNPPGVKPAIPPKVVAKPPAGAPATAPPPGALAVGSKAEVKLGENWRPATILKQEGGKSFVKYDNADDSFNEWVTPDRMRALGGAPAAPLTPATPAVAAAKPAASDEAAPDRSAAFKLKGDQPWAYQPDAAAPPPTLSHNPIPLAPLPFGSNAEVICFSSPRAAKAVLSETLPQKGARLQKIDLASGDANGIVPLPNATRAIALSPDAKRVALVAGTWAAREQKGRVEVWEIGLTPKRVVAFTPYPEAGVFGAPSWAAFIDSDHLLTAGNHELVLWELPSAKAIYTMELDFSGEPALSPGGKYVMASNSSHAYLFEALTGKSVGDLPDAVQGGSVAFRPDGKQAISYGGSSVTLYDLAGADAPKIARQITLSEKVRAARASWVADGFVLLNDHDLLDLEKGLVVWQYEGVTRSITGCLGGRFYFPARFQSPRGGQVEQLASATLPEARVTAAVAALDMTQIMVIRPGVQVSLSVSLSCDETKRQKIVDGLTASLQKNGMTIAEGQPIQLAVSEGAGDSKEISYRLMGQPGSVTTTVSAKKISIDLTVDGQVAWHQNLVAGVPFFIQMKKDESIEQAVAQAQDHIYDSVPGVRLPKFVPKPSETVGFGKSTLTAKGPEPAQ